MRYFFRRHLPPCPRLLLIESGSRHLIERLLGPLRGMFGEEVEIDLVTCFPGVPEGFRGKVYRIADYGGPSGRGELLAALAERHYPIMGMVCSAEPIMTKWKWWLGWKLRSKIFVINENADFFWFDWAHRALIAKFATYRAGLTGSAAVPTLVRFLLFPLTLAYLILYAAAVHARRKLRLALHRGN